MVRQTLSSNISLTNTTPFLRGSINFIFSSKKKAIASIQG